MIRYLRKRPAVQKKIAIYDSSMGSYWSLRLSSHDHRAAVVVSSVPCFNPNNTIFTQSPSRSKQMFMYMAGYDDEDRFDKEVAKDMTVRGHLDKIKMSGVAGHRQIRSAVEHQQSGRHGLPCLRVRLAAGVFPGQAKADKTRPYFMHPRTCDGPWTDCGWTPPVKRGQACF